MLLTEVEGHAHKDNEAKPRVEIGDKVNDGYNNVSNCWDNAEHNVAVEKNISFSQISLLSHEKQTTKPCAHNMVICEKKKL